MSRKLRKGYYVNGEFVLAASTADRQIRSELQEITAPSRTELKNASEKLQKVGEQLVALPEPLITALPLPEALKEAIFEAKRITKLGARRRQTKLIGKLIRRLEPEAQEAALAALRVEQEQTAKHAEPLHQAEKWRDALIADDAMLEQWIAKFPRTDAQQLRSLIRQARKDARETKPGEAQRHGRIYRQIFKVLYSQICSSADAPL
jgi:ribosome-associated protein